MPEAKSGILKFWDTLPGAAKFGIVLVGGFGIYKGGRALFKTRVRPPKVNYPTGGSGIPVVGIGPGGEQITWKAEPLSKELHMTMDAWNNAGRPEAFRKLATLPTDDMFVAVYDTFNHLYADELEENGTLKQWVWDEWGARQTADHQMIMNRFDRLSLS